MLGCPRSPYSLQLGPRVLMYNLLEMKWILYTFCWQITVLYWQTVAINVLMFFYINILIYKYTGATERASRRARSIKVLHEETESATLSTTECFMEQLRVLHEAALSTSWSSTEFFMMQHRVLHEASYGTSWNITGYIMKQHRVLHEGTQSTSWSNTEYYMKQHRVLHEATQSTTWSSTEYEAHRVHHEAAQRYMKQHRVWSSTDYYMKQHRVLHDEDWVASEAFNMWRLLPRTK